MKFNVSSSALFSQLQAVSRVIAAKNSLQILEDVLFEMKGNSLTLTASDSETTIRTTIEVENAEGEGKVALGAKLLLDTLKEFPEQAITFSVDEEKFAVNLASQNGTYSFIGEDGNQYPEMPIPSSESMFMMPATKLLESINKTLFCTADDELRPVMNGIYFDLNENALAMVATDAHRLVRFINKDIHSEAPIQFILPKKPAVLLKNVLGKDNADVKISTNDKNACFEFGRTVLMCRLIEGRYPNYSAVIPQNNENIVTVDRQTILNACKRVAVFANTGTSLIKLTIGGNQIKVSAQDIDFSTSAEETIPCAYEGMSISIGFKAPFLIEIIAAVNSNDVVFQLADPARAGLILPSEQEENEDLLMLLMPMLLND